MSLTINLHLQRRDFSLAVDTSISHSGVTAIYGPSGAGKTTLLRWLAGLEPNGKGLLKFNGQVWQDEQQCLATQDRKVGYVFQDPRLFPHLSVQGNLHFAFKRRFNDDGPTLPQVCDWLKLTPLLNKYSTELSGGEQQRVAIGRALLSSPQLLFMDEPLASLDHHSKQQILFHLERLQQHLSIPILYVSHSIEEVSRLSTHLLLLDNGQLSAQGPTMELMTRLDVPLSHEENASSFITTSIRQHDEHYHLTELLIDDQHPLYLTQLNGQAGEQITVRIPARDVSLCLNKAEDSSILNIIPATIDEIETSPGARVLIRLLVGKQYLLARVTQKSVERLQLQTGQQIYAQIKTVALHNRGLSER